MSRSKKCRSLRIKIEALITIGNSSVDPKAYKKALALCEKLLELSPKHQKNLDLYTQVCRSLGLTDRVYYAYQKLISLEPENLGHYDKAIETLSGLGRETEIPSLLDAKAQQLMMKGEYKKALSVYEELESRFPASVPLYQKGKSECLDSLEKGLAQMIEKNPKNEEHYKARAKLHKQAGNKREVERSLYLTHLASERKDLPPNEFLSKWSSVSASLHTVRDNHFSTRRAPSIPAMLCSRTSVFDEESENEARATFQALGDSPLFKPIAELAALEKELHFFSEVEYENSTTKAQFRYDPQLITFKQHPTIDNAIHELCHLAEKRTGIIKKSEGELKRLRKEDKAYFTTIKNPSKEANAIYKLVIKTPADKKLYDTSEKNEENIVRIAEAITLYGKKAVKDTLPNLYSFFKKTFLPAVSKAVENRKEELEKEAIDYVSQQLFVPQPGKTFGTKGKAVQKREALRNTFTEQLLEERASHPKHLYSLSCHYLYDDKKPIQTFVERVQTAMEEDKVFKHKPKKDNGNNHYMSIQPENFKKRKIGEALEESFVRQKLRRTSEVSKIPTSKGSTEKQGKGCFIF